MLVSPACMIERLAPRGAVLRDCVASLDALLSSRPASTVLRGPPGVGKSCLLVQLHDAARARHLHRRPPTAAPAGAAPLAVLPISLYVSSLATLIDGSLPYFRITPPHSGATFDVPGFSLQLIELLRCQNAGAPLQALERRRLACDAPMVAASGGPLLKAGVDTVGALFGAAALLGPKESRGLATSALAALLNELVAPQVVVAPESAEVVFAGLFMDAVNALYMKTAYFDESSERLHAHDLFPAAVLRKLLETPAKRAGAAAAAAIVGAESETVADDVGLTLKDVRFVGCRVKRLEKIARAKSDIGPITPEPYPDNKIYVEQTPAFTLSEIDRLMSRYLGTAPSEGSPSSTSGNGGGGGGISLPPQHESGVLFEPLNLHRVRLLTAGNGRKMNDLFMCPEVL